MASFDRELPIDNIKEEELYHRYPKDFYGLSKNLISRIGACENFINLRIFSCFSKNEPNDRMIKGSILKCLKNDDIIIYQNRKMDFTYSDDVMKVVELLLLNNKNIEKFKYRDYNLCYTEKFTLLDIAEYISDISNHKGGIVVQDQNVGLPRTGDNGRLAELGIEFKGLKRSIDELFNKLRNSDESDLFNY
jgi:nucleoside-diphosphate-sugar epimerase